MWLRSFAWRNRNHKQRHQGKTEGWVKGGGGGGGTEQVLSSHTAELALPPVPASLTRTTFMYGKQFLCNRPLLKWASKKTDLTLSALWELLAGLQQHRSSSRQCCTVHLICTPHAAHSTLKMLRSCDYPTPPSQTFSPCRSEPSAADCKSHGSSSWLRPILIQPANAQLAVN